MPIQGFNAYRLSSLTVSFHKRKREEGKRAIVALRKQGAGFGDILKLLPRSFPFADCGCA